ncbi:MAG TPA: O-antigen ligase family protein, partial [Terriglobia bacterium]|nr:O-antigen ligase family protein [Terriglobia bacterium]
GVRIMAAEPWLGTGPGTFQKGYARFKPPEAEMTRLVHNDYLQQGCDTGIPALVLYAAWVFGAVGTLYGRGRALSVEQRWVWLGCAAFAVQSLVEFPLYQPALAWPFFLLLGALWGALSWHRKGDGTVPGGR